jgi:hypothetical protein
MKMRHWPVRTPFVGVKPGDFTFSDESMEAEASPPKWFRFSCPLGRGVCSIPIAPQKTGKGHTWQWDGNRDLPTFTPSINCLKHNPKNPSEKYAGCGWHGHFTKGEIVGGLPA